MRQLQLWDAGQALAILRCDLPTMDDPFFDVWEFRIEDSRIHIVQHLARDIRTVQRWQGQGLPVHRLQHLKHGSVYAYRSEIDHWWTSRQPRPEPKSASIPASTTSRFFRPCLYTGLGFAIALSGIMGKRLLSVRKTGMPAPAIARSFNLAVLPVEETSQNPQGPALANSFMQSLISNLKLQRELHVLDETAVDPPPGSSLDLKYLVSTIHADQAISTSIRRENDRTRITARLIDARSGNVLWMTQFEQKTADPVSFQNSVAHVVALDVENALSLQAP